MEDIRPSLTGFIEVSVSRRKSKLDTSDLSDLIDLYNEIYSTRYMLTDEICEKFLKEN